MKAPLAVFAWSASLLFTLAIILHWPVQNSDTHTIALVSSVQPLLFDHLKQGAKLHEYEVTIHCWLKRSWRILIPFLAGLL